MIKTILTIFLISSFSYADILMLNFNGNTSTINAAKVAALKRGEKVIVIPKSGKEIDKQTLEDEMARISQEGIDISSMIFSGHDGGGYFSGRSGGMNKSDVEEVMSKYPEIANGVDSLILRGCYTATPGESMSHENDSWNGIFPNLNMIAGYIGAAPSSERKYSKSFIEEILSLESKIYMADSVKTVEEMFENISNSKWTTNSLAFKMCQDDEYKYVARPLQNKGYGAMTMDDFLKMCDRDEIDKHLYLAKRYFNAMDEYENPPLEHHGTKLREAYTYLNGVTHCQDFFDDIYFRPDLQKIIKLIYFDYIKSNFLHHYGNDFEKALKGIEEYNKENSPRIKPINLETASRKDILKFINDLYSLSPADILDKGQYNYAYKKKDDPNYKAILRTRDLMQQTLHYLEEESVPFDWVSTKKSPEKGVTYTDDKVYLGPGLSDSTDVEDLRMYSYEESIKYYFKNYNDESKSPEKAEEIVLTQLSQEFHSRPNTSELTRVHSFLKHQVEKNPVSVVKILIRSPRFSDEKTLNDAIKTLKEQNYKLSEDDYSYFENSYISDEYYSVQSEQQKSIYKQVFKELSDDSASNKSDLFSKPKPTPVNEDNTGPSLIGN